MKYPIPFCKFWQTGPRYYQIAVLSSLLLYGIGWLNFEIGFSHILTLLFTALSAQSICTKIFKLPRFDPLSPLISALSLCLLLRANSLWLISLTMAVTIFSKFVLRWNKKHIFNPTNFGLVAMMLLTRQVWVSPGQWGSGALLGFLLAGLGGLVIHRAARSDVTYAFLLFYTAILICRAVWLGDPLSIPHHQLQNGGLLIFAFYMISDPRTTPDSRAGRILFALLVAAGAGFVHFGLFRTNGLLWSLAFFAPLVPLIDRFLPGHRYEWKKLCQSKQNLKGVHHETNFVFDSNLVEPIGDPSGRL
ncbi:MAG: RnfABCDGE type electron transport complex subunit D [Candidatus Binatia bacterium]